jgi:hypothetical protein
MASGIRLSGLKSGVRGVGGGCVGAGGEGGDFCATALEILRKIKAIKNTTVFKPGLLMIAHNHTPGRSTGLGITAGT